MFGFWEAILAYLTRQIGLRTDAADPAGSLHAKVADVKSNITTLNSKVIPISQTPKIAKASIGGSSYATVVSVSGSGFLTGITVYPKGNRTSYGYVQITIDGTTLATDLQLGRRAEQNASADYSIEVYGITSLPCLLRFNTSLLVQGKSISDSYDTSCDFYVTYSLV